MINSSNFKFIETSQHKGFNYPNVLICGSLHDINEYSDYFIKNSNEFLCANYYIRTNENKLEETDLKDFNLIIYIVSCYSVKNIFEDRYIYNIEPEYKIPAIYICVDIKSYYQTYYFENHKLVLCLGSIKQDKFNDVINAFLKSHLLTNEIIERINDIFVFGSAKYCESDIKYYEALSLLHGIGCEKDNKQGYEILLSNAKENHLASIFALQYMHISCNDDFLGLANRQFDYEFDKKTFSYLKTRCINDMSFQAYYDLIMFLTYKSKERNDPYFNQIFEVEGPDLAYKLFVKHYDLLKPYEFVIFPFLLKTLIFAARYHSFFAHNEKVAEILKNINDVIDLLDDGITLIRSKIELLNAEILLINNKNYDYLVKVCDCLIKFINYFYEDEPILKYSSLYYAHSALWEPKPEIAVNNTAYNSCLECVKDAYALIKLKPCFKTYLKLTQSHLNLAWYCNKTLRKDQEKEEFLLAFKETGSFIKENHDEILYKEIIKEFNLYIQDFDDNESKILKSDIDVIRKYLIEVGESFANFKIYPIALDSLLALYQTEIYSYPKLNDDEIFDTIIKFINRIKLQVDLNLFPHYNYETIRITFNSLIHSKNHSKNINNLAFILDSQAEIFTKLNKKYHEQKVFFDLFYVYYQLLTYKDSAKDQNDIINQMNDVFIESKIFLKEPFIKAYELILILIKSYYLSKIKDLNDLINLVNQLDKIYFTNKDEYLYKYLELFKHLIKYNDNLGD